MLLTMVTTANHGLNRLPMFSTMVVIIQVWLTTLSDHCQHCGDGWQWSDYGFPSFWPWSKVITTTIYYQTMVNHAFDWGHHDQHLLTMGNNHNMTSPAFMTSHFIVKHIQNMTKQDYDHENWPWCSITNFWQWSLSDNDFSQSKQCHVIVVPCCWKDHGQTTVIICFIWWLWYMTYIYQQSYQQLSWQYNLREVIIFENSSSFHQQECMVFSWLAGKIL